MKELAGDSCGPKQPLSVKTLSVSRFLKGCLVDGFEGPEIILAELDFARVFMLEEGMITEDTFHAFDWLLIGNSVWEPIGESVNGDIHYQMVDEDGNTEYLSFDPTSLREWIVQALFSDKLLKKYNLDFSSVSGFIKSTERYVMELDEFLVLWQLKQEDL